MAVPWLVLQLESVASSVCQLWLSKVSKFASGSHLAEAQLSIVRVRVRRSNLTTQQNYETEAMGLTPNSSEVSYVCLWSFELPMPYLYTGADPEKYKEGWLIHTQRNFQLINYSLGCINWFVSIHMLLQLSVFYHRHEEHEASYAFWLFCSKYRLLSEWLICASWHHTLFFTRIVSSRKKESAQTKNQYYGHCTMASHPIHPPGSAPAI